MPASAGTMSDMPNDWRVSPWVQDPSAPHAYLRHMDGGLSLRNRVAFIEKTPRVRVAPYTSDVTDANNWTHGPKGSDGLDERSRMWCDERLLEMGYILPQVCPNCDSCDHHVTDKGACASCYRDPATNGCDNCGRVMGLPYPYVCGACVRRGT